MLTRDYRPVGLQDVCGQELALEAVKAVVKNPDKSPRVLIFHGEYGTGKTSLARILARALNCDNHKFMCKTCEVCTGTLDFVPYYQEFDSAIVGHKDDVLALRDDLFVQSHACQHRVVVMDEFHLASKASQGAFLKVLEDLPPNVYVVFCTTQLHSILPTIQSRAVVVPFTLVAEHAIKEYLIKIVNSAGIDIEDSLLDLIAERANGHVRDAVMSLDTYVAMENPQTFLETLRTSKSDALQFLLAARTGEDVKERIHTLLCHPTIVVQQDLFNLVTSALEASALQTAFREVSGDIRPRQSNQQDSETPRDREVVLAQTEASVGRDTCMISPTSEDPIQPSTPTNNVETGASLQTPAGPSYTSESVSQASLDSSSLSSTLVEAVKDIEEVAIVQSTKTTPPEDNRIDKIQTDNKTSSKAFGAKSRNLSEVYNKDLINVVAFLCSDWACNALKDSVKLAPFLWAFHLTFRMEQRRDTQRYRRKTG